ncbi:hypothetical protein AABB24_003996, partial [Solanum stoloniferum]
VFLFLSCNSSLKPISNCISFSSLQQLVAERDDIVAKILLVTSNTFVLVFFVIAVFYLKCWAFEVVPFLQKKYKVFSKQVSSPRIFRWLLATNNELVDINELFDPPQDSIVHPWILPTSSEMEMKFFTKFVPKKLTKDDKIEKFEIDLYGVVAIKRDIIIDEHNLDVGGGGASSPIFERVFSGVGDGGGGEFTPNVDRCTDGVDFERGGDFGDISGGFGVGTSSPIDENIPCLQETPSTKETIDLLNVKVESLEKTIVTMNAKIESLEKAIVTMKSKRGIRPSSKISHPYTPDYVKRTKRQISKALSSARKKKKGKVNETIIEKELVSGDSKGADIADEEADSNSKEFERVMKKGLRVNMHFYHYFATLLIHFCCTLVNMVF